MDMFIVRGGKPLCGRVAVSGAKNAALPIMAAVLAADGPVLLRGVPDLVDVATLGTLLGRLGVAVERRDDQTLAMQVVDDEPCVAEYDLVRRMRASVCVLGPLLGRRGRACVSLPGGCNIGDRPIDLHLKGLRALGADIRVERGYVIAQANRLIGTDIYLGGAYGSTVTGTCNVMTAAVFAEGFTTIESAACEPEVVDLGNFLIAMGAKITGLGTPFLHIEGVKRLSGVEHTIIPDRIEAATLMIAAALTRGRVEIDNVVTGHMTAVIEKLREIGVTIRPVDTPRQTPTGQPDRHHRATAIEGATKGNQIATRLEVHAADDIRPADCIALPYPGIPTDVQAQMMALLSTANGNSIVTDKVFPDRFLHAPELVRLGSRIRREGGSAIIGGVSRLSGACVMASDLRASAALVLAALAADGPSVIRRIYHLDRGYDRLERKLCRLGADIVRTRDEPANMPADLTLATEHQAPPTPVPNDWLSGPNWLRGQKKVRNIRTPTDI